MSAISKQRRKLRRDIKRLEDSVAVKGERLRAVYAAEWVAEHTLELEDAGITAREALDAIATNELYWVNTQNAGHDCYVIAADSDDAIYGVADYAGALIGTPSGHVVDPDATRGWSAESVATYRLGPKR